MPHAILDAPAPVAFAHRGGAWLRPENTLPAFEHALELGSHVLEMDVHTTADGALVVCHDETVDRTTDGRGAIAELSLAAVQSFDAGYRFSPEGGGFPYRGRGVRIPTLEEVAERFPNAALNVELKSGGAAPERLWRLVDRHALGRRLLVAARDQSTLGRFRALSCGSVPTAATRREILLFRARLALGSKRWPRPEYTALQIPPRALGVDFITERSVDAAHRLGVKVHAWTIDDPGTMRALLDAGVDGIMTDRPERLLRLIASRAARETSGSSSSDERVREGT